MLTLTEDQLDAIFASDDTELQRLVYAYQTHPYYSFRPRPDRPEFGDEQSGFIDSTELVSFCVGGNGSGKTYLAAQKCAQFLLEKQAPPKLDTPFWVISNTYDQVCGSAWFQKLREIIPAECIDHKRITWKNVSRQWPYSVPLMPWPDRPGKNWMLEFKSYEQGREMMQATAIGGAWFTEQFPWDILEEVLRGCREYMYPGSVFAEFTPIDPALSAPVEELYEQWSQGQTKPGMYGFYRMNTEEALKAGHVSSDWYSAFFGMVSDEMQDTRRLGAFASYEGAIYQTFDPKIHVFDHPRYKQGPREGDLVFPVGVWHRRGFDWGASEEHPFVCLWAYKNAFGQYVFYDEYYSKSQTHTALDHIEAVKAQNYWGENDPYYGASYGDPSRPDMFRLFDRFGIQIQPANNAVDDGIETIRRHLKKHPGIPSHIDGSDGAPRILIDRQNCPNLVRTLRTYRWEKSSGKGLNPKAARPKPLKMDDDCPDAARYLIHTDSAFDLKGIPTRMKTPRTPGRHGVHLSRGRGR